MYENNNDTAKESNQEHFNPANRQPRRIPECEACGSLAPEGGGANVGDETFGWVCSECRGDSALVEYGVKATDRDRAAEYELVGEDIEVVLHLTVSRGAFYVEHVEVRTR